MGILKETHFMVTPEGSDDVFLPLRILSGKTDLLLIRVEAMITITLGSFCVKFILKKTINLFLT